MVQTHHTPDLDDFPLNGHPPSLYYKRVDPLITWSLGGYEFGLEIESVLGKFEKTIYNDI